MNFLTILLLIIFLILESSVTTIPLVFVAILCLTVIYKKSFVFFLAFLFGILTDVLSFDTLGVSSAFFIIFLFLVLTYQRKFEIDTYPFISISTFIGSFIFLLIHGYTNLIFFQALINTILGLCIYYLFKRFIKLDKKSSVNI